MASSGPTLRSLRSADGENMTYRSPDKTSKLRGGGKAKNTPSDSSKKRHHGQLNGVIKNQTKITEPLQPKNAKVIGPAQLAPSKVLDESQASKERTSKRQKVDTTQNSKQTDVTKQLFEGFEGTEPPTTDSSVHLLVQGLQSGDRRMLDTVFTRADESVMKNTIDKLPLDLIPSLLNVLRKYLYYKGDNNIIYMRWLEKLIHSKLSFILTLPDLHNDLTPICELLNVRTDSFDRALRLKGRLNLMLSLATTSEATQSVPAKDALLKYQEESTSEDEDQEGDDDEEIMGYLDQNQMDVDEQNDDEDTDLDDNQGLVNGVDDNEDEDSELESDDDSDAD
jgi:hypothetical protein